MSTAIDANRYSRQTAAYGEHCGRRIFNSVCVVAWSARHCSNAVVAETLKNLALSGIREVILIDDGEDDSVLDPVFDVSTNSLVHPYIIANDIDTTTNNPNKSKNLSLLSSNNDDAIKNKHQQHHSLCQVFKHGLLELNSQLIVQIAPTLAKKELTSNWFERVGNEVIHQFDLLLKNQNNQQQQNQNQLIGCFLLCHPFHREASSDLGQMLSKIETARVPYTHVQSASVFGRITNNFGDKFVVVDPSSAQPTQATVSGIGADEAEAKDAKSSNNNSFDSRFYLELVAEDTEADAMSGSAVSEGDCFRLVYTGSSSPATKDSSATVVPPLVEQLNFILREKCDGEHKFQIVKVAKKVCPITGVKSFRYFFHVFSKDGASHTDPAVNNMLATFCRSAQNLPLRYCQVPSRQIIDKFETKSTMFEDDTTLMFSALTKFAVNNNHNNNLPRIHSSQDADQLLKYFNNTNSASSVTIVRQFARTARLQPSFFATYLGAFAAQEILKFFTQRWVPMTSPMSFDMISVLPTKLFNNNSSVSVNDLFPTDALFLNNEEEEQQQITSDIHYSGFFGTALLEKMRSARIFLVGAGALGCEYMKIFALMGLCSTGKGALALTDDDSIAVSNLSRQLLFRPSHVGQNKSLIAANSAKQMAALVLRHRGGTMVTRALQLRLDADSTHPMVGVFNHRFWSQQTILVSGVDNVKARSFLSEMSQQHLLPLVDGGTNGPLGHVAAILPFITDPLAPQDQDRKNIPVCTLHFFPTTVAHCSHHALATFKNLFSETTTSEDPMSCEEEDENDEQRQRSPSLTDALRRATALWFPLFVQPLLDLRKAKPPNATESDGQTPYWNTTSRRCPEIPVFDPVNDEVHRSFVVSCARLWLKYHNLISDAELETTNTFLKLEALLVDVALRENWAEAVQAHVNEYVPKAAVIPNEAQNNIDDQHSSLDRKLSQDGEESQEKEKEQEEKKLTAANAMDFEKDDEDHLSFVWAATAIRARCYSIFEPSKSDVQRIAGRMVPALITTTAAVVAGGVYNCVGLLAHHNPQTTTTTVRGPPRRSPTTPAAATNNTISTLQPIVPMLPDLGLSGVLLWDYMINVSDGPNATIAFQQLLDTSEEGIKKIDIGTNHKWCRLSLKVPSADKVGGSSYSLASLVFDLLKLYRIETSSKTLKNSGLDQQLPSALKEVIDSKLQGPSDIPKLFSVVIKLRIGVTQEVLFQHTATEDFSMMDSLPSHLLITQFLTNSAKKILQKDQKDGNNGEAAPCDVPNPPSFVESEVFVHYLGAVSSSSSAAASAAKSKEDEANENGLTILARLHI